MKRLCSLLLIVVLVAGLVGCSSGDKLSGSFSMRDNEGPTGFRYEFIINESGRGDYGGELKIYNAYGELESTEAWYIDDELVYVNGTPYYTYRNGHLYSDEPIDGIIVNDDGSISGNNRKADEGEDGALIFTNDLSLVQIFASDTIKNENNHYYVYWPELKTYILGGMYVVDGDIVTLDRNGDNNDFLNYYFYILDNTLRETRLDPV